MELVQAKCPNCNGVLEVDSGLKAAICPYCNTAYIVQEAIHHYSVNHIQNIHANVVNVLQKPEDDFVIRGGVLTKYNGKDANVVVPDGVIEIGRAFEDCIEFLRSVTLPDSVEAIGESAFFECEKLERIRLPDGLLSIRDEAFGFCSRLRSIRIPESVIELGESSFQFCDSLTSVRIPGSIEEIPAGCFENCEKLSEVVLEEGVRKIAFDAFTGCDRLERMVFPDSIDLDSVHIFLGHNYSLKEVSVPTRGGLFNLSGDKNLRMTVTYRTDEERRRDNCCLYCGGSFKGLFKKVCAKCGKEKSY